MLCCPDVDFGFAAAGYTMQEQGMEATRVADCIKRTRLIGGQNNGCAARKMGSDPSRETVIIVLGGIPLRERGQTPFSFPLTFKMFRQDPWWKSSFQNFPDRRHVIV